MIQETIKLDNYLVKECGKKYIDRYYKNKPISIEKKKKIEGIIRNYFIGRP